MANQNQKPETAGPTLDMSTHPDVVELKDKLDTIIAEGDKFLMDQHYIDDGHPVRHGESKKKFDQDAVALAEDMARRDVKHAEKAAQGTKGHRGGYIAHLLSKLRSA